MRRAKAILARQKTVAAVVVMSVLFEATGVDADDRVVGSVGMVLLLVVQIMVFQIMVFSINLGIDVPIVPIALAGGIAVAALAIWFEVRQSQR